MKEINVTGQKRTDLGKKASKALRKEGFIPCNLYGEKKDANGAPEALSFAVPFTELRKIIYTPHVYVINLLSLIHISEPTRLASVSRMPSSA